MTTSHSASEEDCVDDARKAPLHDARTPPARNMRCVKALLLSASSISADASSSQTKWHYEITESSVFKGTNRTILSISTLQCYWWPKPSSVFYTDVKYTLENSDGLYSYQHTAYRPTTFQLLTTFRKVALTVTYAASKSSLNSFVYARHRLLHIAVSNI